jgi:DNA-directed RNA polymerase beta subunit
MAAQSSKPSDFEHLQWAVIDAFYKENSLVKHQLDSYNDFVLRKMEEIIEGFNPVQVYHHYAPELDIFKSILKVDILNPVLCKPTIHEKDGSTKLMTPNDARLRNFTYAAPLTVDVRVTTETYNEQTREYITEVKKLSNINLAKIPIMVRSKYCVLSANHSAIDNINECQYDVGGYFVINGNEKVVISQDRMCENKTYVFTNSKGSSAYSHIAEIRSVSENRFGVPKTTALKLSAKPNQFGKSIRVNMHHIKQEVPLFIVFKALGIENDKAILEHIVHNVDDANNNAVVKELVASIDEASDITCSRDALEYLSKYLHINGYPKEIITNKQQRLNILRSVLEKEFLPHVGHDAKKKAVYLGYMTRKLVCCYLGLWKMDDRDSYINKRADSPGVLMANLFRQYFGKMVKDMRNMIQKEINNGAWKATGKFSNIINKLNVYKIIKSTVIESGMKYALATGNWGIKSNKNKQGVAQVLNRMTYNATLSHLRRVNTPLEKSGKLIQPRKLHSTQFGYICPSECFDPKTPILMWDGTIKEAKDIIIGDCLIDDNGNAVRVRSTCAGVKAMYEIIPSKRNFMSYTVTDNHILTLKVRKYVTTRNHRGKKEISWFDKKELRYRYQWFETEDERNAFMSTLGDIDDNVVDITIEKYMALPENVRKNLYLFKSDGINWEHKDVALDPYLMGMWLGDGNSKGDGFSTADMELRDKYIQWGKDNDATITAVQKYKYSISSTINKTQNPGFYTEAAPLKKFLNKYGLVNNKHIPKDYIVNDRATRLAVLAGLIDTDGSVRANGHQIRIAQGEKNFRIINDAEFLARSLGYSCHVYDYEQSYTHKGITKMLPLRGLAITGEKLFEIPTVLPRKKLNKFDNPTSAKRCSSFLQSSFQLIKKDIQPYVGWQLEGSGRFLLGDMSISHNTPEGAAVGLVKNLAMSASITIASNSVNVRSILQDDSDMELVEDEGACVRDLEHKTKVIVNGDIIGTHNNPIGLYKGLKGLKRNGTINVYTSIVWDIMKNEINVNCEGGRLVRPMLVVENNKPIILDALVDMKVPEGSTWKDLVCNGYIEFLDVDETNASMIAMKLADLSKGDKGANKMPKYTHMEIHPSLMLGVLAGSIPFSDHNQAPRNCFPVEDHEVLTEHGFLGLDDILNCTADGKQLAVACHVNGHLEFHKIGRDRVVYQDDQGHSLTATEFVSFESKKRISDRQIPGKAAVRAVASNGVSVLATTNHNMYGRLAFADKLGPNSYRWPQKMLPDGQYRSVPPEYTTYEAGEVLQLADHQPPVTRGASKVPVFQLQCNFIKGVVSPRVDLPFVGPLGLVHNDQVEAFLWLYGYWLGDGWLEGTQHGYITVGPKKQTDVEELTKVFARLPLPQLAKREYGAHGYWKAANYDSKGQWIFTICSTTWWNYFAQQYGHKYQRAEDINSAKWFWSWVFQSLNVPQLKIVLAGLSPNGGTIHTSSARFRDEVERVCILAGYSVLTRRGSAVAGDHRGTNAQGKSIIAKHDAWDVRYTTASISATPYLEVGEDIKMVKMQEPVPIFCVSVPTESHLIMVRRKASQDVPASRATIVGNTYQCLHVDETVLMADGSYKKIKDVIVGDNVVTFDPLTKETTTTSVVHQYVRPASNDVYVVSTISGRSITATSNHNFMTTKGWAPVESFDNKTMVGINMCPRDITDSAPYDKEAVVIDGDSFKTRLYNAGFMISDVARMCNAFDASHVVPMKASSRHLPTLARICGYIRGAGCLEINKVSISFETEIDARAFDEDVASLGIERVHPVVMCTSDCVHNEGKPMPWQLTYKDFLPALLHGLGASSWVVPGWVVHGNNTVKREYLAGYQGAVGKTIIFYDNKCHFPMTALVSTDSDRHALIANFVEEMRELFIGIGIEMQEVVKIYDDDLYVVGFKIEPDADNLVTYFERVAYRYNTSKLMESGRVVEYIKHIHHQPLSHKPFSWWLQNVVVESTSLFVPIESKMMIDRCMISDITVAHKNHSFIAGDGFLSSNSAMGKQAIGIYSTNFKHRFDTMAHVLNYPQKPLVQTKTSKLVHNDDMPCGVNIIVAIMCMTGFNQEDSIIMNQSAVDRGLFSSTYFKTYKEQNNRNHSNGEEEFFTKPSTDTTKGVKPFNYSKLCDSGFVPENTYVTAGDVIIGKCMPQKKDMGIVYKDTSVSMKNNECGYVDKNCYGDKYFTNINGDGYTFTKVRIRNMRVPTVGDKFSSKHGQKGTVGILYRQEDMPFTKNGLVPDIIINPHAIPSRMTIAQLMECLLSKSCVVKGEYGDATPFTDMTVEDIAQELEHNGLERYGNELMYNCRTGEQIDTQIYIGPTFYQRLKHMTCDKVHSRGNAGPIVLLTRQPAEGRAREGGLRIGEMELDSCLGHSVMSFLKERFMESSDNYRVFVCRKCGMMANVNPDRGIYGCKPCKNTSAFAEIRIPYAAKLLFQEMGTMSIATRFLV